MQKGPVFGAPIKPEDAAAVETTRIYRAGDAADDDNPEADESQPDLSFLQPSSKPGSIGRLGHYEVLQVLGQGGFGIVFKAFDQTLQRMVGVKVMNPQMAATSPPRKRFLREARAAAAIRHENVVQVYSVEEQPLPYLVMEYIDGPTLKEKFDATGPLETPEVLHLGRQIASGLAAAQAMGLIHRDIKPGNILLEQGAEHRAKITDFGLARTADDASLTRSGSISGTPMYMAPEQAMGLALDHRSDLFSLGSVLYEMATGRPPFRAANTIAVLRRVAEDTPRPMQEIIPEIPDWLVAIVTKLHAKKPEDRFQSAREVADLLARCQSELQLIGKVSTVPVAESLRDSNAHPHDRERSMPSLPSGGRASSDADRANEIARPAMPADSSANPGDGLKTTADYVRRPSPESAAKVDRSLRDRNTSSHGVTRLLSRNTFLVAGVIGIAVLVGVVANPFRRGTNPTDSSLSPRPSNLTTQSSSSSPADALTPAVSSSDAESGRSPWDDLDASQIPEAERVPRRPEGLVAVLGQHRRRVWSTPESSSVSRDGTQFTLTTDDGLYLFGRDPKQPARLFTFDGGISCATFLPDGRIAAFVADGGPYGLHIFAKPRDGMPLEKQTAINANNDAGIDHATASADGHWLAAFDNYDTFGIWRLGDAAPQRAAKFVLPTPHGGILPGSFSPDAQWFCFTDNSVPQSAVHLIDLRGDTPREATVLKADADENSDAPAKGFEHAAFLSDGRLATADRNGRIWFWNINDGEPQRVGSIRDAGQIAAAAKSLRMAVYTGDAAFRIWDLATDPPKMLGDCRNNPARACQPCAAKI